MWLAPSSGVGLTSPKCPWPALVHGPGANLASVGVFFLARLQQLRQLGDTGRNLPRFILRHEIRRSTSSGLIFKIDVSHGEVVGVADDVGDAAIFLDGPLWETAIGLFGHDRDLRAATRADHRLTVRVAHLFAAD
jgi:hypothetical protein